ncbi:MAG: hypothetical protein HY678_06300 [Chloroflexi bacterium]|nr:hypothetical protein [Chloroflexota bacterium]
MTNGRSRFCTDEEVPGRILSVLRDARKYAILVTPYLGLWPHAEDAIVVAVKNRVDVKVILRADPQVLNSEDVQWLLLNKVKVATVEGLHAKIYLNEAAVVVSSMNLTRASTQASLDFALTLHDDADTEAVREYVTRTVVALAQPVTAGKVVMNEVRKMFNHAGKSDRGHCVRCGTDIDLDPSRPLCPDCYDVWAAYKNPEYAEKVCHSCGRSATTSYAKPLCSTCYRSLR